MSYSIAIRASIILALSIFAIAATGCGGGTPAPSPTTCIYDPNLIPGFQLVYPAPNATGVPASVGTVIYATGENEPIELESGQTLLPTTATAVPSPLPSPAATFAPGQTLYAVSVAPLAANTQYTVNALISQPDPCTGLVPITLEQFGSFKTH